MEDIHEAAIKVIAGPEKKSRVVTARKNGSPPTTRQATPWSSQACPTHDPVHQITIVPAGTGGRHDHHPAGGGSLLLSKA